MGHRRDEKTRPTPPSVLREQLAALRSLIPDFFRAPVEPEDRPARRTGITLAVTGASVALSFAVGALERVAARSDGAGAAARALAMRVQNFYASGARPDLQCDLTDIENLAVVLRHLARED